MKLPKTWPKVVDCGHSIAKIYRTPSNGCDQFTVVYYVGKKRVRKTFADYALAYTEAETVTTKLSQGELSVVELKGEDRLAYVRAMAAIADTGVPLEMAAIHFAEAHKILNGASLLDAARFFAKHHPSNMPKKTVPEVVAAFIEAKEADGLSDVYLKDLKSRLGRFERKFTGRIGQVTATEIEAFLRDLKGEDKDGKSTGPLSPTSRNNYRRAIGTLFYFAESRGYVPKGIVDIESVAVAKKKAGDIEIFRPEEMARIMAAAKPELIPFLAIGAFAGLRSAEIERLDWSEVRLEDGLIEVKAGKAKTASRRLVPITDNLRKWLMPHHKKHGAVCAYANMSKQLMWLAEKVDAAWKEEEETSNTSPAVPLPGRGGEREENERIFEWKHNALRHSFISYRVADIQNVAQVALEAGNSPRMVFSNYRELVRPADAKKWFAIEPNADAKTTVIPKAGETEFAVA